MKSNTTTSKQWWTYQGLRHEYSMNAYDHLSYNIQEIWYNMRSGLYLKALPTHKNAYVGDLDEGRKDSTGQVDNLKLINSKYRLHILVNLIPIVHG